MTRYALLDDSRFGTQAVKPCSVTSVGLEFSQAGTTQSAVGSKCVRNVVEMDGRPTQINLKIERDVQPVRVNGILHSHLKTPTIFGPLDPSRILKCTPNQEKYCAIYR